VFAVSSALKNLRRYARRSALYALVCAAAVLTLQGYAAGIGRGAAQLAALPDAMPVSARAASLDGSRFDGLQIPETVADGLIASEHVTGLRLTVLMGGYIGASPEDYLENQLSGYVAGANGFAALEGLPPDAVEWLSGYDGTFLQGREAACIADAALMARYGWRVGDVIPLNPIRFEYLDRGGLSYHETARLDTRIVGAANLSSALASPAGIVLPFETVRALFHRLDAKFSASSASFFVRDAARLNEFKAEMKELGLKSVVTDGSAAVAVMMNAGAALMVNDAAFISAATRLREALSLLRGFLPAIALALAAIGYFAAYLMIQSRREEYAVLRLLGMSRRGCMALYFTDMAALTLGGSVLGALLSIALGIGGLGAGALVSALFSVCFTLGGVLALARLGRVNVMLALARAE
jgi:hypothetical protein